MTRSVRFAVIGTGKITQQLVAAGAQDPRFVLQGVYSRSLNTAKSFAEQYHVPFAFDDLNTLAACEEVDAVYVASPNSCHAEQAIAMMRAGKHVLCEKPIAADVAQLTKMINTAKQHQVCLMEAMLTSFLPNLSPLQSAIEKIGQLRLMRASFCQYSSRYDKYLAGEMPNTFNRDFANGALMDIGIYPLYLAHLLLGQPDSCVGNLSLLKSGVDGAGCLLLDYQQHHHLQAQISFSKVSSGDNIGELQGELGRVNWHHSSTINSVTLTLNTGESELMSVDQHDNRMVYEVSHFIDLLNSNLIESPVNSWQRSLDVLSIIEDVRKKNKVLYPSDQH